MGFKPRPKPKNARALNELSSVDWATLRHAHGPATDVPNQLRALVVDDPEVRARALALLSRNIFHQGTRYSASCAASPFLVELVRDDMTPGRDAVFAFVLNLALGYPSAYLADATGVRRRLSKWSRKAYDAARDGAELYVSLLDDESPSVRLVAAHVVAWFADTAPEALVAVRERLAVEGRREIRASLLIALGMLSARAESSEGRGLLEDAATTSDSPVLTTSAAIGLAYMLGDETPDHAIATLEAAAADASLRRAKIPWNDGDLAGHASKVLQGLGRVDAEAMLAVAAGLATASKAQALSQAIALIKMLGLPHLPDEPVSAEQLSEAQSEALRILATTDDAWYFTNLCAWLRDYGLVCNSASAGTNVVRRELMGLLGLARPKMLDRRLHIVANGVSRSWPIKHCLRAASPHPWPRQSDPRPPPVSRAALVTAMTTQLAAEDAIDVWVEAAERRLGLGWDSPEEEAEFIDIGHEVLAHYALLGLGQLLAHARRLVQECHPYDQLTPNLVLPPLSELLERTGKPLHPAFDRLLRIALGSGVHRESVRQMMLRLSPERLERLLVESAASHALISQGIGIRFFGAWDCFDLAPTPRIMRRVIELVRTWDRTTADSKQRAVELLVQGGEASIGLLREALADSTPRHARVFREALDRLQL